jgi:hypothetical protein
MKISKSEKRDCKEQKRLAEIEVEKLALKIDKDFVEYKVEKYIKHLNEPLCDKCIFRLFEFQKQIILNQQLKGDIEIQDRKPEKNLYNKLVLDVTKQCSFCISKYFEMQKQYFSAKNCEILIERDLYEQSSKRPLTKLKLFLIIFCSILILQVFKMKVL